MSRLLTPDPRRLAQWLSAQMEADMAAELIDWRAERALRDPSSREAWDLLPALVRQRSAHAQRALLAIASDAHRGWIDPLLDLEGVAWRSGHGEVWLYALEACLGPQGPLMADRDVLAALHRASRALRPAHDDMKRSAAR